MHSYFPWFQLAFRVPAGKNILLLNYANSRRTGRNHFQTLALGGGQQEPADWRPGGDPGGGRNRLFISSQRAQKEIDAGQALTSLMVNPGANRGSSQMASAFEQLAATYAGTSRRRSAPNCRRRRRCSMRAAMPEAQAQFKKYLDANPTGSFAATAELGHRGQSGGPKPNGSGGGRLPASHVAFSPLRPAWPRRNLRWAASPSSRTN